MAGAAQPYEQPRHQRLEALARLMVPLHLILDRRNLPRNIARPYTTSPVFATKNPCSSCLRKARIVNTALGKQLKAGVKLQYWIVDMGGGFN